MIKDNWWMNRDFPDDYDLQLLRIEAEFKSSFPIIASQLQEKRLDLHELEEEIKDIKEAIDDSNLNINCWVCNVSWTIEKFKTLVELLIKQVKLKEQKIELLKNQIIVLNTEKDNLKDRAYKDNLTWLYNRYYVDRVLKTNIKRIDEWVIYNFCVWIVDLDYFKIINDNYGHCAGDMVLKNFSNFMLWKINELELENKVNNRRQWKRNLIFRYWGEEFLVLSSLSRDKLKIFLDKCLNEFSQITHIFDWNEFKVTFSAWITEYMWKNKYDDPDFCLIKSADKALYQAKDSWRKKVIINHDMD